MFLFSGVFYAEGHSCLFSKHMFVVLRFSDVDDLRSRELGDWFQLEDVTFSGVWGSAVVEDLLSAVFIDWLKFNTDLLVHEVDVDVLLYWEVHLNMFVVTGDVLLVVEGSDESNLSLGLSGEDNFDFASQVQGLWSADLVSGNNFWVSLDTDVCVDAHESWGFQGVDEWQTHGSWEAKSHFVWVQEFGVVEFHSLAESSTEFLEV